MTDWTTVASLATAGGTLVLAAATFASVRSTHRAAIATERALRASIRPVLVPSRLEDPPEKVGFADDHWIKVEGGRAYVEGTENAIYLAIALRNVGNGLAVLDRWDFYPDRKMGDFARGQLDSWRRLTRDIYVPASDRGFWQGAFRDATDPVFAEASTAIRERRPMTIDLLYGDHEGGQRTVTRFNLSTQEDDRWIASVSRHWNVDQADPR
jgi:hypothetical protein